MDGFDDTLQIIQGLVDSDHEHKDVLALIVSALKITQAHASKLKPARQTTLQTLLRELRLTVQHVSTRPRLHAWVHNAGSELSSLLYRIQHFLKPILQEVSEETTKLSSESKELRPADILSSGGFIENTDTFSDSPIQPYHAHDQQSYASHKTMMMDYVEQTRFRKDVLMIRSLIELRISLLQIRAKYNAFVLLHDRLEHVIKGLESYEHARLLDIPAETLQKIKRDRIVPPLCGLRDAVHRSFVHVSEKMHSVLQQIIASTESMVHENQVFDVCFEPYRELLGQLSTKVLVEPPYVECVREKWDECVRHNAIYLHDADGCTTWNDVWDRVDITLQETLMYMNEDVRRVALRAESAAEMKCSKSCGTDLSSDI